MAIQLTLILSIHVFLKQLIVLVFTHSSRLETAFAFTVGIGSRTDIWPEGAGWVLVDD